MFHLVAIAGYFSYWLMDGNLELENYSILYREVIRQLEAAFCYTVFYCRNSPYWRWIGIKRNHS